MEYTVDQKKDIDGVKKDFLISNAEGESFSNIWKSSDKENGKIITTPVKMLELTDTKPCLSVQIKQIAGQYYFATCGTSHSVSGYICNLKSKTKDKKCDFKVSVSQKLLKKNLFIFSSNIINESEILILKGNPQVLHNHQFTYLDEDGKSPGNDLIIEPEDKSHQGSGIDKNGDAKMMGLEYDQIQPKTAQHGILNGVNLNSLEAKVGELLQGKPKTVSFLIGLYYP